MPEPLLPPGSAAVKDLMDAATRIFRLSLAKCMSVAMFAMVSAFLPSLYLFSTGLRLDFKQVPTAPMFWVLSGIGIAGYQYLVGVLMIRQRNLLRGQRVELRQELNATLRRWAVLVATGLVFAAVMGVFFGSAGVVLLAAAGVGGGTFAAGDMLWAFLLAVPSAALLVSLLIVGPVVVFEPVGPLEGLRRSVGLTRPLWKKCCACAVIAVLIIVVCLVAVGAVMGIVSGGLTAAGASSAVISALSAAVALGVEAAALVYLSALWLVLYSAASSSA